MNRLLFFFLAIGLSGLLSSCGLLFHHRAKPVTTAGDDGPSLVGTVALVNPDEHFVLVHLGNKGATLPVGIVLRCIGPTGETGQLVVTPERKGAHFAADIKSGNPQRDDSVIYDVAPAKLPQTAAANAPGGAPQVSSLKPTGGMINGLPDPSAPESGAIPSVANPATGQTGVIPQLIPQSPR